MVNNRKVIAVARLALRALRKSERRAIEQEAIDSGVCKISYLRTCRRMLKQADSAFIAKVESGEMSIYQAAIVMSGRSHLPGPPIDIERSIELLERAVNTLPGSYVSPFQRKGTAKRLRAAKTYVRRAAKLILGAND